MMKGRDAKRLLKRMGLELQELDGVEEVVIRMREKELVIKGSVVSEIKGKGVRSFQVMGGEIEERAREVEVKKYTEEDILLVAQQAGVSKERAKAALNEADGDLARAILMLTSG